MLKGGDGARVETERGRRRSKDTGRRLSAGGDRARARDSVSKVRIRGDRARGGDGVRAEAGRVHETQFPRSEY